MRFDGLGEGVRSHSGALMSTTAFVPFPGIRPNYAEISGILVDPKFWTTTYTCDVVLQNCHSTCCYRSNILAPGERARIEAHMEGILPFMDPERRKIYETRGGFEAVCTEQCPEGCELDVDEVAAMARMFPLEEDYRCNLIVRGDDHDSCLFLAKSPEGLEHCSIHAYALANDISWMALKPVDCVQYPLAIYEENGRKVLGVQTTPFLSHLPCHESGLGPLFYESMAGTIRFFMGDDFYEALDRHVRSLGAHPGS